MLVIAVRLIEIASRAGVVLLPIYFGLSLAEVGQYNTLLAIISIFAFAFNFERHYDIQRRTIGQDQAAFDRKITDAVHFYGFNYVLMMPFLVGAVAFETHIALWLIALVAIIVIGEHICTQSYQFAMVNARYQRLQMIVPIRNLLTLAVLGALFWHRHGHLDLQTLLIVWACASALTLGIVAIIWLGIRNPAPRERPFSLREDVFSQHRASFTHFLIGMVAMLVIQGDRLLLPNLLNKDLVGIYARHGTIIAFGYQLFNILSNNRILPEVFRLTRAGQVGVARKLYGREWIQVAGATLAVAAILMIGNALTHGIYAAHYHIHPEFMGLMLLGFLLRAAADLNTLPLHAVHRERLILINQVAAFALAVILMLTLTPILGILGTIVGTVSGASLYLALNLRAVTLVPHTPVSSVGTVDCAAECG